ncbi:MAG: hypothetical protein KA362_00200 [Chloroflexi bacterium]|nr:hypothetical protein [Chloroflexota bacterium]
MNTLNMEMNVEEIRPSGIIHLMPDLDEMITVTEAVELANGRYTRQHITRAARNDNFPGAKQVGRVWLIPRVTFEIWLNEERRPGPKTSD